MSQPLPSIPSFSSTLAFVNGVRYPYFLAA